MSFHWTIVRFTWQYNVKLNLSSEIARSSWQQWCTSWTAWVYLGAVYILRYTYDTQCAFGYSDWPPPRGLRSLYPARSLFMLCRSSEFHRGWGRYRQRSCCIQGRYIQWALYKHTTKGGWWDLAYSVHLIKEQGGGVKICPIIANVIRKQPLFPYNVEFAWNPQLHSPSNKFWFLGNCAVYILRYTYDIQCAFGYSDWPLPRGLRSLYPARSLFMLCRSSEFHRGWGRYRQRSCCIQGRYIQWALYKHTTKGGWWDLAYSVHLIKEQGGGVKICPIIANVIRKQPLFPYNVEFAWNPQLHSPSNKFWFLGNCVGVGL